MAGFGLNPLDSAISDADTFGLLGTNTVNPTGPTTAAPGLAQDQVEQQVSALNAKDPGTYAAMTPDEFEAFKQKQQAASPGQTRPFTAGLEAGVIQTAGLNGNFLQAFGVRTGNQTAYDAGKKLQDISARGTKGLEPKVGSTADIHSFGDAWEFTKYSAGNAIGSSIPNMVTGVLATFVTENPVLGFVAGAAAPAYTANTGDFYGMVRDSPGVAEQVKAGKLTPQQIANYAFITGVPLTALDVMGDAATLGLSKTLGSAIDKATVGALKKSIMGRVAAAMARGALAEGSTEGLQQVVQEGVSSVLGDKTPTSQRVIRVLDNALGGVFGGGLTGGGAHAVQAVAGRGAAPAAAEQPITPDATSAQPTAPQPGPAPAPATPSPQPERPAVDPATGATRVYVDTPAETVAPTPAPAPPAGPLGRAMEHGRATETAAAAEAMVPVGSQVAVSMPGVPPLNVTVQGYHADGMDVVDASGEVHTLPMNDPEVTVTPLGGTAPMVASEPHPEPLPETETVTRPKSEDTTGLAAMGGNMGAGISDSMYKMLWSKVEAGDIKENGQVAPLLQAAKKVRDAGGLRTRAEFEAMARDFGSNVEAGTPTFQQDMRALVQRHMPAPEAAEPEAEPEPAPAAEPAKGGVREAAAAAAPKGPTPGGEREVKPVPFSFDVAGKQVAFPNDGLASLYDVGQRRNSFRQAGRNAGGTDKLIAAERQRTADLLGIPLEDVNQAADEYRRVVEQAAKSGKDEAQVAPTFDPKTLTAARDAWNGMEQKDRKAILDQVGVKRSPKMQWDALGTTIQNKIKPAMEKAADTKAFPEESGTLGIPRDEMPQIPTESHGGLVKHLNANGIDHETKMVPAAELKPTQAEFSPSKVEAAKDAEGDRAVIVANDGHIIDGHHQALAAQEEGKDVKAIVLDAPIETALEAVKNSPSAQTEEKPAPTSKSDVAGAATFPPVDKTAKWFSTRERAQTSMEKKGLTASHEIVQTQKQRFEIRPKAVSKNVEVSENVEKSAKLASKAQKVIRPDRTLRQDWGVENIDGYAQTPEHFGKDTDFGVKGGVKDAFLADARDYLKSAAAELEKEGFKATLDRKGKPLKAVNISEGGPAVSGDVSLHMERDGVRVYAKVGEGLRGGISIMYRAGTKDYATDGTNRFSPSQGVTAHNLADLLAGAASFVKSAESTTKTAAGKKAKQPEGTSLTPEKKQAEQAVTKSAAEEKPAEITTPTIDRLQQVHDKISGDRNTPEGAARGDIRAVIDELQRRGGPRADIGPILDRAASRIARQYPALHDVLADIAKQFAPAKPAYGASNKLVTADRAAEVRAKLKAKLKGQLNSGIDPEVLALGAELAAFHIEAGSRKFADFARAVAKDLGTDVSSIRKYLRSWYNGARDLMEDSGFDVAGMDNPETVRAQAAVIGDQESKHEPTELGQAGAGALEGAPAETVPSTPGERDAGSGVAGRGGENAQRDERTRGQRVQVSGGVGDGEGAVSVPARPDEPVRDDATRQSGVEAERAGDGKRSAARRNEKRSERDSNSAERIESQVKKDEAPPKSAATPAPQIPGNFVIRDEDEIGEGGQRQKVQQNLEAIRLLKQLAQDDRRATRAEQAVLAKYVGWGGLKAAFPREDGSFAKGWEATGKELRDLLGPEEYKAAANSTQNAHYTSPEIVKAMWDAVRRLGFGGGRVLEPSVGVGNFFGLMPGEIREHAQLTGVEKDWVTGGIAKHLYPDANVQAPIGFEQFATPDGYFDLAIGNPPFGSERIFDPNRKHLKFSIHNFFFAKSLDSLRPGGLMAMVVSDSLMDAQRDNARRYLADRADLVGAVRLPNNAFEKNAGTSVTTDILFLRKRAEGEKPAGDAWVETRAFTDAEGREMPLNEYYHAHPENVLGKLGWYGTMRPEGHSAVVAPEGQDTPALLRDFIARLPERPIEAPGVRPAEPEIEVPHEAQDAVVGSMFMDKAGKVWVRGQDLLGKPQAEPAAIEEGRALERIKGLIGIRDAFANLRKAQLDAAATDDELSRLRGDLNKVYDGFVAKNGPINLDANRRVFHDDPTWPQLSALEDKFDKGISSTVAAKTGEKPRPPSAQKAAIFTKRTQHPYQTPTSAPSAKDALAISQNELGKIDLDYMSRLYGKTPEAIVQELGPLVFKNPEAGWQSREDYLSGNVKRKLALAVEAAKADPSYQRNVEALKEVIPADLNPVDIRVAPGAHWVPPRYVEDFAAHITETDGAKAFYSPELARWVLSKLNSTPASEAKWGTQRASVTSTLEAAINGRTMTIKDRQNDGSSVVNQVATEAANEKVARIRDEWKRWLWQDDSRRDALAALYNDTFNTDQPWEPDGSHLKLPGTVDVIELRPHQKNFIWRVIQRGVALADHVVGAGKTFAVIGSIMEMRRLGLAKKPMLVVPNHLVEQWGADFMRLYPGANILAATKKDFEAENRRRLFARIATGDYDAVIVAHSSFGKIPVDLDYQRQFIESQVADMEASISALRAAEGKKTRNVAQLEKARDNLRAKLQKLLEGTGKDEIGLTFQDIGIDALAVDEAHEFKNLAFSSSMQRVAGLGNQKGSQKAADLYMKTQAVLDKTGGRNAIFATGTPVSNTMAEMFTIQRYLDNRRLSDLGLAHFDAWARQFGEIVSDWELSPSGKYKMNSRFAKFVNVPELLRQYKGFADVITREDIERQLAAQGKTLGIPKMVGGKPQNVIVDRTEHQANYIGVPIKDRDGNDTEQYPEGSLIYRAEHLPKGPPKKGDDNMLKIMSDARKAALDMRLIDANYPDPDAGKNRPVSKVGTAAVSIKRIYDQWHADKGTQLVFIDLSTPKKAREKEGARIRDLMAKAEQGDEDAQLKLDAMSPDEFDALTSEFSVYDDLRAKLLKLGIPDKEIAFIHDANTDKQKAELFGKVRSGDIRVLLGSTAKMGAGMNVQERLVALHHIDAPWRPSDLEQREGRIIRQGNSLYARDPENFEVGVYRYATKNTLDARMWQTIEGKARFIEQLRKGDLSAREIEDVGGEAANAAEMKAAASGNPLILEEMDLRQKVRKLDAARSQHDREQFDIKRTIQRDSQWATRLESELPALRKDAETIAAMGDKPAMKVGAAEFEKPKEFGDAILVRAAKMIAGGEEQANLGEIGGFPLTMSSYSVFAIMANGQRVDEQHVVIEIGAKVPEEVKIGNPKVADATGVAMKLLNTVRKMPERVAKAEQTIETTKTNVEKLRALVQPWGDQDKLEAAEQRHRDVINQLRPKKKDDAPRLINRADAEIAENGGRFNVVNKDGQRFGEQPADGFHTRAAAEDWITDQVEKNGRKESVPVGQSALGMSPDQVRAVLDNTALAEPIGKLIDAGKIVIEPTADSDANAYVTDADGVIHLVAPNLRSDGDVTASLLHEAFHSGVRPLIGDKTWSDLLGRLNSLYNQARRSGGGARAVYDKALARMAHAQETSGPYSAELTPEEFGAYVISEHETTPRAFGDWAREVIGAVKAWALRRFGRQIGAVTPDQLRSLAMAAIRDQVAGTAPREDVVASRRESISDTKAFKAWFGGSKVVDADGRPLVVYRGQSAVDWNTGEPLETLERGSEFPAFNNGEPGVKIAAFFTDDPKVANKFSSVYKPGEGSAPATFPVYLSVKKPFVIDAKGEAAATMQFGRGGQEFRDAIRSGEYDGVIIRNTRDEGNLFIPLRPEQIKSVYNRGTFDPANPRIRESVAAPTSDEKAADRAMPRTVEELSDAVKALSEDQRDKALALLPLNVLPDWAAPNQVAVQQYIDTKRRMDTYHNKKQTAADEIVQRWRKAVGKGGAGAKDLADVMHQATLLGFDPARPSEGWESEPEKAALMKRYKALTPNARAVYEEVRDAYKREADERDQVILENVSKAMDQELRAAERTRDKDLARIRDEGLTGEEKKEAVKAAEDRFTRAQQKLRFSKKARLAALRAAFESNRVPEPYFPLARFGQYFVTARDDLGKVISFSRAETKMQLNRLTREIRAQLPHANIETGLLEDKGNLRSQMDPRVLADIQAILGNAGVSPEVMDQVWQRYLEAMPDLSIRKRSIHRGGVAGFNDDAMRAFASHMFHAAHQMGRVKFGGDLLELVNQATDQAKQAENPISAQKVANELAKRHEWVMNPKNAAWANAATTLGFLYFLGASPASAAVNLSQTVIMGVPILGGRFGMGKAAAALTKASHDFVSGKGSVETSKNLTEQEKTAITDLYERGALDKSMAHDLAGVADRGAGYNPTRQRVMQAMAFLFHHAERFNREVTALAAYRLARQAGLSHGAAVDKAGELTWLTHFDYSNTNRPRVMQNDAAKVALLFKNFQINMIYRVFRDTQQAFAGDTPQARKEARYQLAGIVGMYALMAGGLGVPLMKQIIIPLWKMLFGNEPDKSGEEEFRDAVLKTLGPQLGGAALDGVPGYLTGTSLTQRIGMGDLWFQSQDRVQTAQDWWNSLANDMLGPVWGMAHNVYNGFNVIRDGKGVARGVEMAMPTAAKNLMRAWRYSQEGVVNLRGDTVVPQESLGLRDALKQALGFTPAQVAEQYTRNDEKANMDKRIGQQRKQLLDAYAKAHKAEDEAAVASALADIRRFNAEPNHAAKRITGETIRDSIRTRARLSNRAENGIIIQNRRQNTLLNERLPPRVY